MGKVHYGFSPNNDGQGNTCTFSTVKHDWNVGAVSDDFRKVDCIRCLRTFSEQTLRDIGITVAFNGRRWVIEKEAEQ